MLMRNRSHSTSARRTALAALVGLFLLPASPLHGHVASSTRSSTPARPPLVAAGPARELAAGDLEAFLDGLIPQQLNVNDIAGAVVCVVKDGQVLLAKGYGFADMERRVPVSPDATLFRVGSISKLVTWTTVMQLVEQGRVDLGTDVNTYLDFVIPQAFSKPITLRHLMTHTAGFEESAKDLLVATLPQRLDAFLINHIPRRVCPPGERPSYSNYGAGLAAYVVQRVSGMPFEDYADRFVFRPLSMRRSTFLQPPPPPLRPLLSMPYSKASAGPRPFEIVQPAPAGALSASATDMGRFMLAHLQGGSVEAGRILRPDTVRLMHARAFGVSPSVNGMALGFYEENRNGRRIIGHAGDTKAFHSDLHLMLDDGVGFFVSYNSAGRNQAGGRPDLWQAFLDRYYPAGPTRRTLASNAGNVELSDYVGTYSSSRRSDDSIIALFGTVSQTRVYARPDGTLSVTAIVAPNGQPRRFVARGPNEFVEVDGQEVLAFRRATNGRLSFQWGRWPVFVFERIAWWESRTWVAFVAGYFVLVVAGTLALWPIAALLRRRYASPLQLDRTDCRLRLWTRIASAAEVAVAATWLGIVLSGARNLALLTTKLDFVLHILQVCTLIVVLATVVVFYNAYRGWAFRQTAWGRRGLDAALACASVAFVWLIVHFNFLDFTLRY
jgi:CubicO group peptidase (beta-lactamase class C family)